MMFGFNLNYDFTAGVGMGKYFVIVFPYIIGIFILLMILAAFAVFGREGFAFMKARLFKTLLGVEYEGYIARIRTIKDSIFGTKDTMHKVTKIYEMNGVRFVPYHRHYYPTLSIEALRTAKDLKDVGYPYQYVVEEGLDIPAEQAEEWVDEHGRKWIRLPFKQGRRVFKLVTNPFEDGVIEFYEPIDYDAIKGWQNMAMAAGAMKATYETMKGKVMSKFVDPIAKFVQAAPALIPLIFVIGIVAYLIMTQQQQQASSLSPEQLKVIVESAVKSAMAHAGSAQHPIEVNP